MESIKLFVPGRLCLIGEHSDWAGTHRMMNAEIVPGMAIVTGIEQGIYATAEKAEVFIIESNLACFNGEHFECRMDTELLRETAAKGGFFSYVAGVASYVNEHYKVGGVHIVVTNMTLPIKNGLSSSAAICVLAARAFNKLYHLHLNTVGEMNIAYMGEQRTPSRCGRMDQACAFGTTPVLLTFDGNDLGVKPLTIRKEMHWVITDLHAKKDTIKILADLNRCYPFATTETERRVHEALGKDNNVFINEAVDYLERGDLEAFGSVMEKFQRNFDEKVAPACVEELTSPVLHSVLKDPKIRPYVFGCKGVGSQGDGTAQFLAKDKESQDKLIKYLKKKYDMDSVAFTLRPRQKIRKAIIPVAGFATRLYPVTKNLKKAFFPVMDTDGMLKPVILILLEQLVQADIEEVCLVIGEGERGIYEEFFRDLPREYYDKLSDSKKYYEDLVQNIGKKITYVIQKEKKGFGHAVYLCRDFTKGEPVLLLLGDMIYHSYRNENCMAQMIQAYERYELPVISLHTVQKKDVVHYGIVHGNWEDKEETLLKLDEIKEKPSIEYAEEYLGVKNGKFNENYYAVFGQYILTEAVFDALKESVDNYKPGSSEVELTSALETTRSRFGMIGYVVAGKSYDVGIPEKYWETMKTYGEFNHEL